ncbi:zinc finger protein 91-like [Lutzomyia longipalpis]|uniref:zinc finger protein 91-like n=1 Tax=Lutzomyia longipalpis TaxID=7200 RepID=UPI0024838CBA|nr:zinc finger protein 91-like [Lutzomyia longipalpis]
MAKIAPRSEFLQLEGIQLDSLCRLCGNMNINLIPVIAEDGQETELLQKIVTHLKILVNPEDVLPKKLCIHCTNTLVSWHSFYESCRETNEKFHAMISCAKNGGIEEVAEDLQPEVLPEDGEEAEMDEYIEFLDKEDCEDENVDLLNEEEEHLLPGEVDLGDARCSKDPHGENLKKSPLYDEDFVLIDTQGALENEAVKLEICDLAVESEPEEAPRPELVEKNLFIRRSGQFICPQCPKSFRVKKEFVQHLVEEHEFSENVKNGVKIRPEIDPEDVKRAEVEEDGRLMYKCSECRKILKSLDTFVWHRQIHTGVKMFSCHLCKKTFRIQQGLNRHIREFHYREKKYPCDLCGQKFLNRRTANEHRRIHTGVTPFECETCGKAFKQKAGLFIHRKSHNPIPEYYCGVCHQGFRIRYALVLHMKIHTGEREHECEVCHRKFRLKAELQRHKTLHSGEKPFQCPECGLPFRMKRYLQRHMKHHHPTDEDNTDGQLKEHTKQEHIDRVFLCGQCENYVPREELIQHMMTHLAPQPTNSQELPPEVLQETPKETNEEEKEEEAKENRPLMTFKLKCPQCPKEFSKSGLQYHIRQFHEKVKDAKCGICSKVFGCGSTLRNHMKYKHENVRNFHCSDCPKAFKTQSSLYIHRKSVHEAVQRFSCELCYKKFPFRQQLKLHLLTHTKEKTHFCRICQKGFTVRKEISCTAHEKEAFGGSGEMMKKMGRRRKYGGKGFKGGVFWGGFLVLIQMDVQEVQEVQGDVCMEEVIKEELLEEEIFEGEDFRAKEGSEAEELPEMDAPEECKAQRKEKFQEEEKTRRRKRLRREFRQEKSINENLPEGEFPGEASKGKTQEENVQEEKLSKIIKIERDLNEDLLPEGEFHEELNEQDHPEEEYREDDERPEEQINKISEEAQNLMEEESQESPEKKFNQIQGLPEVEFQEEEEEEDLSVKEFSEEDAKNAPGSKFLEFPELPERELKPATKSRENKSNDAFLCEMCHQIFTREYNLMKHLTTHTEDHPCCVCCLSFPTNSALKAHGMNHTREEVREAENCRWVIKCESCSEKFTSTYHLYRHERSSHDTGKMYPCSQCHEVLPSGTLLRIHERRHQVFPCEVCDKVLRSQLALREHQFSHTGEQPYSCQECGKSFRYSTSLLEHQKTHRGVRKYKCSHCDKSFTRSNMLKEHERIHTKERPYRCHICPAKFTQSNSLKKHIRTAHISCKNCGQYFGDDLDEVLHRCRGEK